MISSELVRHQLDRVAYSITPMLKSISAIRDNILRAGVQPEDITDISSFRIVTYFQSSMIDAVEFLLSLIEGNMKAKLIAFMCNNSRPDTDPLSISPRLREFAETHKLVLNFSTEETSYSSINLVFGFQEAQATGEEGPVVIKVLFQVCSIFEEAWGQLSQILSFGKGRAT